MSLFGPPNIEKLKEKRNIKGLTKILKNDKYNYKKLRISAAKALGELGSPNAIEPLIVFYKKSYYSNPEYQTASKALVSIGSTLSEKGDLDAIKALAAVFNNKDYSVRKAAAEGLIRLGAPSVATLIGFNEDRDYEIRNFAKQTLVEIGEPVIISLLKMLRLKEKSAHLFAVQTLEQMKWLPEKDEDAAWYWMVKENWNNCAAIGIPAIKPLTCALEQGKAEAVTALGQINDPRVIPILEQTMLSSDAINVQQTSAEALGKIGDPKSIEPLMSVLRDNNKSIQSAAARALCQINGLQGLEPLISVMNIKQQKISKAVNKALVELGKPALSALINALNSKNPDQIAAIISTLGEIGDSQAVKYLLPFLKGENVEISMATATALGQIGDASAIEELQLVLKHKNEQVRKTTATALDKLGWNPANDVQSAQYWADKKNWEKCAAVGNAALDILLAVLEETDNQYCKRDIIKGLGQIGNVRAIEPIIAYLTDENLTIREHAVIALGAIAEPAAIKPLKNVLQDKSEKIRKAALVALGKIGDAECITTLIQFLPDSTAWVALSQVGTPAVEPLINQLKSPNEDIRRTASDALGKIGEPRAVEPLIEMLNDDVPIVKKSAIYALGMIGDKKVVKPLIDQLINGTPDEVRQSAVGALGEIGDNQALEPMFSILNDQRQSELLRRSIIRALEKFKHPTIVEVLIDQLKNDDIAIQKEVARILEKSGDHRAVEPLIATLPLVEAIQALGEIGDPLALEPLMKMLPDTNFSEFQILICALAALHRSGNLNENQKQQLLQQGYSLLHRRNSYNDHQDQGKGCSHYDDESHTDIHADLNNLL